MTKPSEKTKFRTHIIDDEGHNRIIAKANDKVITLHLKLKSERRRRLIGAITISTKTLRITRDRNKHLFIKYLAYGFNDYIMSNAKRFDTVWLKDQNSDWKFPVSFLLEHGKYLYFKQQGFETQRFLSLEELEPYKVKPKENRRF